MPHEKRPDQIAREGAAAPSEPLFTVRHGMGVVRHWDENRGYGYIAVPEVAPWDVWRHFAQIQGEGYRALTAGETVDVEFHRFDQESFKYVALVVRRLQS